MLASNSSGKTTIICEKLCEIKIDDILSFGNKITSFCLNFDKVALKID